MNKAILFFGMMDLVVKANEKLKQIKIDEVNDITQDIDSDDKVKILICRDHGDSGIFQEPQNVSISKNVLKPETVKVYCKEYLESLENKTVEIFKDGDKVFHLALVIEDEAKEIKPVTTRSKVLNKVNNETKGAKDLVEALVSGRPLVPTV